MALALWARALQRLLHLSLIHIYVAGGAGGNQLGLGSLNAVAHLDAAKYLVYAAAQKLSLIHILRRLLKSRKSCSATASRPTTRSRAWAAS